MKRFIHRSGVCRGFGANVKEREKSGGEWKAQYPKTFYEPPTHPSLYKYVCVCIYLGGWIYHGCKNLMHHRNPNPHTDSEREYFTLI